MAQAMRMATYRQMQLIFGKFRDRQVLTGIEQQMLSKWFFWASENSDFPDEIFMLGTIGSYLHNGLPLPAVQRELALAYLDCGLESAYEILNDQAVH